MNFICYTSHYNYYCVDLRIKIEAHFNEKLQNSLKDNGDDCRVLNKEWHQKLIQKFHELKSKTSGKKPEEYQRLKRCD